MKRLVLAVSLLAIATTPLAGRDEIQETAENTDNLWRSGAGAHDGAYTAISASMIGWGVGLAVGIALLAAALNHGSSSGSSSSAHSCH